MISLSHTGKFLDIEKGSVSFEVKNPLFDNNSIPGMMSFPFKLSGESKINNTLFRFAKVPGVTDPVTTLDDVQLFINKVLWKIGRLDLLGGSGDYEVNFRSDAGDLATVFSNTKLTELNLGSEALNYTVTAGTYPDYNYALFPVKNTDFYGNKNPDWKSYSNYFHTGAFLTNTITNDYNIIPFLYVPFVLTKIFESQGWTINGNWLTNPDIQRLVIYNNYALDALNEGGLNVYNTNIIYANHLPDITIGSFLVELMNMFGIGYFFDVKQKTVIIRTWNEVLANSAYRNVMSKAGKIQSWTANKYKGITFMQSISDDDLTDQLSTGWTEYKEGHGEDKIGTGFSPLFEINETDEVNARTWRVPHIRQPGTSEAFDTGQNDSGLRLMFYTGMVNDSEGNAYPAGRDFYGGTSLRWDGVAGLVNKYYSSMIAFRQITRQEQREIRFNTADMLGIDISEKLFIDYQKYLVESVIFTINESGLAPAKVKIWKT